MLVGLCFQPEIGVAEFASAVTQVTEFSRIQSRGYSGTTHRESAFSKIGKALGAFLPWRKDFHIFS